MKRQLKIMHQNGATLTERLNRVQGKARVNLVDVDDLIGLADDAEDRLEELGIPKAKRPQATYTYRAEGPAAWSFKWGRGATIVTLLRRQSGWYLVDVARTKVYPRQKEVLRLELTQLQDRIALAKFRAAYAVARTAPSSQGDLYAK